jgi:acyl transferase domain-containing protein/NAD(P)-dependent dehydrogenase (short-subunit alcohol dehydrogenase family)
MSCFFPGANDLRTYWANILAKVDAVTEVPETHWDWRLFYHPDMRSVDTIYSKWGGFLGDVAFEPLQFGMPPSSLNVIEPLQLMVLEAARQALGHAGYNGLPAPRARGAPRPILSPLDRDRERTAVILGIGGGATPLAFAYGFRSTLRLLATVPGGMTPDDALQQFKPVLPEWTEDSFPGMLANVAAGRVSNRFDFGGPNFAVDAACASSLCALQAGVRELVDGTSDVSLVMAADTMQTPFAFTAFSRTYALSPTGRCKTFDSAADGIALSEGVAALVLKRLADAERDGDRIYAVIKGVGASSDGKDKGMTAPRPEGQMLALKRAWGMAGLSPAAAGLVEAHGTGTVVGDQTETQVLTRFLRESGAADDRSRALGSVKSMIGHSKCAAGLAGVIKTVLALDHKVLPPTLVQNPNPKLGLDESPLFLNTEPLPWVHGRDEPRRAGVSAFGFGGTNFHVVLEEYTGDYLSALNGGGRDSGLSQWPAELLVWRKPTRAALLESLKQWQSALNGAEKPSLADVAATLAKALPVANGATLAILAASLDDLKTKLTTALTELSKPDAPKTWTDPRGMFFAEVAEAAAPKIAFLFPGQGSQYPGMLGQAAMAFGEVRQEFDRAEGVLADEFDRPLGRLIFPPAGSPDQDRLAREALTRSEVAQPAIAAAGLGMFRLLESLGVRPDFAAGHSFGEYVALCAAGGLPEDDLLRLAHRRGQIIMGATAKGGMVAAEASWDTIAPLLKGLDGVCLANQNSPKQTVLSGTEAGLATALDKLKAQGIRAQGIPVACPFHSPWIAAAREPLARALAECRFTAPRLPVFANLTAGRYPSEPAAFPALLTDHLTSPVRFQDEVVALFEAGTRVFVEVGPQSVLTNLVNQTLGERFPGQALAVSSDFKGRPGLTQLLHLLGQLVVNGVPVRLERLFTGRGCQALNPTTLKRETPPGAAKQYLVNSVRVKPEGAPEPPILGRMVPAPAGAAAPPARPTKPAAPAASPSPQVMMPQLPQPPAARPRNADDAAHVMALFQSLMSKFLDTQKSVMTTYLRGAPEGGPTPTLPAPPTPPAASPVARPPTPATNGTPAEPKPQPLPAPVAAAANGKPDVVEAEWLTSRLIDILSKRTGYPTDMLGPDVDLEAELGIDSIKHVEILGTLAEELHGDTSKLSLPEMEKLVGFKTVRGIVTYLADRARQEPEVVAKLQVSTTNGHAPTPAMASSVHRLLVATEPLPPAPSEPNLPRPAAGVLLITDDGRGLARALADRLDEQGQPAVILGSGSLNLTDADAVESALDQIQKRDGPVAGVVHLLPLAASGEWTARMSRDLESLFLLTRTVGRRMSPEQRGVAVAVTAMGGCFGVGERKPDFFPGQGGIAGFLKSLAQEWSGSLVRAIDLEPAALDPKNIEATADLLLAELADEDAPVEVGYADGRRLTLTCVPAPLGEAARGVELNAESVVVVTGGARGITAAVALELARRHKPTLVLVGRSPLPPEQEPADTAGLADAAKVTAALVERLRQAQGQVNPAAVEAAYQRLLQDRDIRTNLEQMRDAGARVHYFAADVRDGEAFRAVLADVVEKFGGIDGVIHGAGVIADRLVKDKSPESFQKVFGTKVDSALTLADFFGLLPGSASKPHDRLKFVAFFTSVAGRFGNRGQADYAAANEVLSKLAAMIDSRMSTRAVAVAWGPWSGVGMAAALEPHMTRAGVRMIGPDEGPRLLAEELRRGAKGQSEVVLTGDVTAWVKRGDAGGDSVVVQEGAK